MSDSRVILHVGWPKTATTSMQAHLRLYPNLAGKPYGREGALEARRVIDDLVRNPNWDPGPLRSLLTSSQHDRRLPVILSNESLIEMPQREWFDNLVGPFEVATRLAKTGLEMSVLLTLRDPRQLLRSTWLHHLRQGLTQPYEEYLGRVENDRAAARGSFSLLSLTNHYAELFGRSNVTLSFIEAYSADPASFWSRVVDVADTDGMFSTDAAPRLNKTELGPIGLEMTVNKALRVYGRLRRRDDILPLRRWVTRKFSRRIAANHDSFFARHLAVENVLVDELCADIEQMRATIRSM